jgi:hypothetical protein
MKRHSLIAAAALLFSLAPAMVASTQYQAGSVSLTASPAPFSTTLGKVQRLAIRVIPGYCGKVWIGSSAMTSGSTATNAGVIRVLWPSCSGGLSDEWTIQDQTGANSVDTSTIYLMTDSNDAGEQVLWESEQTNCSSSGCPVSALRLIPVILGPVYNASATQAAAITTITGPYQNTGAYALQFATVPGLSGKNHVGLYAMSEYSQPDPLYQATAKVLFPLTPSLMNQTDHWDMYTGLPSGQANDLGSVAVFNEVNSEFLLVTAWQFTAHS